MNRPQDTALAAQEKKFLGVLNIIESDKLNFGPCRIGFWRSAGR